MGTWERLTQGQQKRTSSWSASMAQGGGSVAEDFTDGDLGRRASDGEGYSRWDYARHSEDLGVRGCLQRPWRRLVTAKLDCCPAEG